MSLESKLIKQVDIERNIHSYELFNKPESQLEIAEFNLLSLYMYDLEHPIWKDIIIDGKNTGYKISNTGEVKGLKGYILKPFETKCHYISIGIHIDNKCHNMLIHRLVATAFIPNPENKPQVNHINGNKHLNWWRNLEWNTFCENMEHAVRTGLLNIKGEKHPESVYTEKQIEEVCKLLENNNKTPIEIQNITGVNTSLIFRIREGSAWTHISSKYNIPNINFRDHYSINTINNVCKLLTDSNNSYKYINANTGVAINTIIDICRGKSWKHVSKNYTFPSNRKLSSKKNIIVE